MENPDFPSSITRRMEQKLETELSDIERLTRGPRIGIGGGTYLIGNANQKWVARVVKNPPPEMKRMPLVQQRAQSIGVAVPTIIDHSFEQINDEEFMWVIEEYVEGTEFFEVRGPEHLDSESRQAILADLGRQLRRLHAIEIKGFGSLSVDLTSAEYATWDEWIDEEERNIESVVKIVGLKATEVSAIHDVFQELRQSYQGSARLCHGDISEDNLLVSNARLVAVIDWEVAFACDPAYDAAYWFRWHSNVDWLACLLSGYKPINREAFQKRIIAHSILIGLRFILWSNEDEVDYTLRILENDLDIYATVR